MMGLQGVENPYLAPMLPLALIIQIVRLRRWKWLWCLMGGIGVMAAVVLLFRGASGDYESVHQWLHSDIWIIFQTLNVLGLGQNSSLGDTSVGTWPAGSMDSIHIQGRDLGISGLVVGVWGLFDRRLWAWVSLAVVGLLLVTGSDWGEFRVCLVC